MRVGVYILTRNGHAGPVCRAFAAGVSAAGDAVTILQDTQYDGPEYDAAALWGYVETCQNIMKGYRRAGKQAVYLDLGYWNRGTHYKVSVGARHPTAYFQRVQHPPDRRLALGVDAEPYRYNDSHILLAGMGAKAAWAEKLEPAGSWEQAAVEQIRKYTDRPIVYRPKPSWGQARPIAGTEYSGRESKLKVGKAYCVVTHHSNVAVEGLAAGVPAFAWDGVATPLALQHFDMIEKPFYPADPVREQWLNDVAYCQWSLDEMKSGMCWKHLRDEGLVQCAGT